MRTIGIGVALLLGLMVVVLDGRGLTLEDADSLASKIQRIQQQAEAGPASSGTDVRTSVTEAEVNSWLAHYGASLLPEGVVQPRVTILGNGRVSGTAIVDLDSVARSRATGRQFDVWTLIGGRVPVTVTGRVSAAGGSGRMQIESADVSGVPVPPRVVEQLVLFYSRTSDSPDGFRVSEPFVLPAGIERVEIGPGAAVVVQ